MSTQVRSKRMPAPAKHSIGSFTRVTKSHLAPDTLAKPGVVVLAPTAELAPTVTKKRSRSQDDASVTAVVSKRTCVRSQEPQVAVTPSAKQHANSSVGVKGKRVAKKQPSAAASAHKPAAATVIAGSRRHTKPIHTQILETHRKHKQSTSSLPQHLADLVKLNKALLKTVTLHIAHHGSHAPIDLRSISTDVSRTWGKRQVTVEDIRRCIAGHGSAKEGTASPLAITDYGRGRVCIELKTDDDGHSSPAVIDTKQLCRRFEDGLHALCADRATDVMSDNNITMEALSLDDLPRADVTHLGTRTSAHPLLSRGQQALAELKNDVQTRRLERESTTAGAVSQINKVGGVATSASGTKLSVLDRIRIKAQAAADGPASPTPEQLQRRAALNRVSDVAATISMMSLATPLSLPRQAFSMLTVLEKLRDSLRVPVGREEGAACVRLIAAEVAPEWLRVVQVGGRENVVVQRTSQPVDRVISERVEKLLANV